MHIDDVNLVHAARAVRHHHNGEAIDNLELISALRVLPLVRRFLSLAGERYKLTTADLTHAMDQLEAAAGARKREAEGNRR